MGVLRVLFVALFTVTNVIILNVHAGLQQPRLEIRPNNGFVVWKTNQKGGLTCKPVVEDPKLITNIEWRDQKNRKIEKSNGQSSLYVTELLNQLGLILRFSGLQENQAGNYTCVANYANSEQLKAVAHISIYDSISFDDAPESQFPKVGENYLVKCKISAKPQPFVEWFRNMKNIVNSNKYVVQSDGLLIKNVTESDDGVYKCGAYVDETGEFGDVDIKVEVLVPPTIEPLKEVSVIEGESASLKCVAKGKPPPTYKWIKENSRDDLSKTSRFDVKKTSGELFINKVEFNDDSIYKCVVENEAGIKEETVKINVLSKPQIDELANVTAPTGVETKIICKAKGRPTPMIQFRKLSGHKKPFRNGQQPNDIRISYEQRNDEEHGISYGTLIIANLNRTDDGLYECIAKNIAGEAYRNGHITVEFKPTFERTKNYSTDVFTWNNHPGNLTCLPEAIPNATFTWKYGNFEITNSSYLQQIDNGPVSYLIVRPIEYKFYTQYECVAKNKLGSSSIFIKLREAKKPDVINDVRAESITATTIKFNIQPPQYFEKLPIRTFIVQYERSNAVGWDYARNHTWSFNAPYILEGLRPEMSYKFRFAAQNDVGIGYWSSPLEISMPRRSEPAEPRINIPTHSVIDENHGPIVISPYADHFELQWNVPSDNGDPLDSYFIRYCVIEKINGQWNEQDCSEQITKSIQYTSFELNELKPDTTYKIEVRAHNAIGASSPAQIRVRTSRGKDVVVPYNEQKISTAAIIGIVIAVIFVVLLIVDLMCFYAKRMGILAHLCGRSDAKHDAEEEARLGREEREPLKPNSANHHHQVNGTEKPISVEFDGKNVYSKSGEIIGKHSAV